MESLAKADQELEAQLLPGADPEEVAPFLGTFSNPALGDIALAMAGDRLMMDAGEFVTELRPRVDADGRTTYIMYGPLWASYELEFKQGPDGGEPSIVVLSPPDNTA